MDSKNQLAHADTLPDATSQRPADPSKEDAARRILLSLAREALWKELGCYRLCELALAETRDNAQATRLERYRWSAHRRATAVRWLVEQLAEMVGEDDSSRLRQATARQRVACLTSCLQTAVAGRDPELARTVANECVAQARLMARSTWARLLVAAEVAHLDYALVSADESPETPRMAPRSGSEP